jgi:hypothetical protein
VERGALRGKEEGGAAWGFARRGRRLPRRRAASAVAITRQRSFSWAASPPPLPPPLTSS